MQLQIGIAAVMGCALLGAISTAQGATVLRSGATSTSYADVSTPSRVWNVQRNRQRIRVTLTGTAVVIPYTWGGEYGSTKIPGPQTTLPAEKTSGNIYIECIRKGEEWFRSRDSSRSIGAGTVTFPLPLKNAFRCRIRASVSAYGTPDRVDDVSMTVTVTADTVK